KKNEPKKFTRRQFIKLSGVVGGGALIAGGSYLLGKKIKEEQGIVLSDTAMSTFVTVSIFGKDRKEAENIAKLALSRMKTLESELTRFRPSGAPARLNRDKKLNAISGSMKQLIETSMMIQRESDGAFDPAILPVLNAVKKGGSISDVKALREITGDGAYAYNGNSIKLKNNKVELTFDGVAKGFIIDEVVKMLAQHGVRNMILDAGGDIQTLGNHPDGRSFVIGIKHPRQTGEIARMKLSGRAVATSGDYENNFSSDYKRHHLVDPKSGKSANNVASATVVAPNAMLADAWSTALFVLGSDKGIKLLDKLDGIDGLVITKEGKIIKTSRFPLV
ncbi:MAG: FAD:protein FMN transferase, partial [Planctomycetes bacterium]|nr:FAD:protein FMN transferase [Planctomycetota bacterium]